MLGNLLFDLQNFQYLLSSPWFWISFIFQVWMFVDAIRQREYIWAIFILFFSVISAVLYFFFVYRQSRPATQGFELPGSHERKRIKELKGQIHHLDKAHHYSQLGDIYFQQGKLEDAEKCYRDAMERDAEDLDTQAHLGQCLLRRNQPEEARTLLEHVCTQDPKHDYGHSMMALAETLAVLGETENAIRIWEQVTKNHSYPRARVQLAELYMGQGRKDQARAQLMEVLEDAPYAPAFQKRRERYWVKRASNLIGQV